MPPPSTGRSALLLVGTLDLGRVVGALRPVGLKPVVPVDPEMIGAQRFACAVVDPDCLGADPLPVVEDLVGRLGGTPLIALSGPCSRERMARLVAIETLVAIVARDHITGDEELRHALLCLDQGPTFGWEGLMAPDAQELVRPISGSADRDPCLDVIAEFAERVGVRRRITSLLQDVADELITNAVYDAPTDAHGRRLYLNRDRREAVILPPDRTPVLRVARDASHVAVSVNDPWGSLSLATVRFYLAKGLRGGEDQVDQKDGGAGLGLTRVYGEVDRMTVKVARGRRTEVMAMIEVGGARKDMASRPTALVLAEAEG